ncbi:MAG TPA: glycosyltransferase family 87 protein [Patescibacteria group bacterium]
MIKKNLSPFKICVLAFSFFVVILTSISLYKIISTTTPDFNVLWHAASYLPTSNNPYMHPDIFTGVGYPPNTLLFYLPLTIFNYQLAQTIFILLILITILGSIYLSLKISIKKFSIWAFLLITSLVLISFPTKFTLGMGQNNSISLFMLLSSFYFYKRKNYKVAGLILGLTISLKTVFGFFILFFILKQEWKVILYSLIPIAASTFLVALVSRFDLYEYYLKVVIPPLLEVSGREIYYNQGITGFISRLLTDSSLRKFVSLAISFIITLTISVFTLKKKNIDLTFSLFVISLPLIDSLSWQHHFIWLLFPFIILASYSLKQKKFLTLMLIGIAYLFVSWNFKNPNMFENFPISLVLSNTFYGAVILFLVNIYLLRLNKTTS